MTDEKRLVHELTPAVRRYRRRVLAMLDERYSALFDLEASADEIRLTRNVTSRLRSKIAEMR